MYAVGGDGNLLLITHDCMYPDVLYLQVPLDRNRYWIEEYVLVSNFCDDGTSEYCVFSCFEHSQFLSSGSRFSDCHKLVLSSANDNGLVLFDLLRRLISENCF